MFTLAFWKAAAERAAKTAAQSLIAVFAGVYGFTDVNWSTTLNVVGVATVLSVLSSIVSSKVGGPGPSAVDAEKLAPAPPQV